MRSSIIFARKETAIRAAQDVALSWHPANGLNFDRVEVES
jgi:hypothetical protein